MAVLKTDRLVLRPARQDDLAAMHEVLRDPRATAFWSSPAHESLEVTREWLDRMMAIVPDNGEDFVVQFGGRVIGKAGLYRFPELGFILHPDFWGMGLAREALTAVIDRAFAVHRLPAIVADVDPGNAASLGLLRKLGFHQTGYRERSWLISGKWFDSVDLALSPEDWAHRKKTPH